MRSRLKSFIKNYKVNLQRWLDKPIVRNSQLPTNKKEFYIGNNTVIDSCVLSPFNNIGSNTYLFKCEVGSYTYFAGNTSIMNTKIGSFCSIASRVGVSLGKHPSSKFVSTSPVFFSLNEQCGTTFADKYYFEEMVDTVIGNDVWIGYNSVVLDGVEIGHGAIVGAGAVVTKNVPPYAIVAGSPAKIIKYRFNDEEIAFLLKFEWWKKHPDWIKENFRLFHDVKLLMLQD